MYYFYILKSMMKDFHYYGVTKNIFSRLKQHNMGKVKSTKAYRPYYLIHAEEFTSKTEALKRERFAKSYGGWKWLKESGII